MADLFSGASAQSTPSVFNFGTHAVRIVVRDGEPWFVATDVAAALGYLTAKDAARNLSEHQKGGHILPTPGGEQRVTIINESGLYRLVLRSRKPEAEKFSDWVTGEVLPSIRKTGRYEKPGREMTVNEMVEKMTRQVLEPNGHPALLFMPLVNAVLRKQGFTFLLPVDQAQEITERLERLGRMFHPMSDQAADVIGVGRALRGLHPRLGTHQGHYREVLPPVEGTALFRHVAPGRLERISHG